MSSSAAPVGELYFQSLNPSQPTTLLFLHGGFGSHAEWLRFAPQLTEYHLLLPDLPSHGFRSSSLIRPYTIETCITYLAPLIKAHANNSRAHVIGFSLGGYVALMLAAEHPELVGCMYLTGCGREWGVGWASWVLSKFFWTEAHVPWFAVELFNRLHGIDTPDKLKEELKKATVTKTHAYARELKASTSGFGGSGKHESIRGRIEAPTLVIAGSLHDPVGGTSELGRLLQETCEESRAVKLEGLPHGWLAAEPDLFLKGLEAWLEGRQLPGRFVYI